MYATYKITRKNIKNYVILVINIKKHVHRRMNQSCLHRKVSGNVITNGSSVLWCHGGVMVRLG